MSADEPRRFNVVTEREMMYGFKKDPHAELLKDFEDVASMLPASTVDTRYALDKLKELIEHKDEWETTDHLARRHHETYVDTVTKLGNTISNHVSHLMRNYTDLVRQAQMLDLGEARMKGILDQREALPPDVKLKLDLSDSTEVTERRVANEEKHERTKAEKEAFDKIRCDDTVSSSDTWSRSYRCDKKHRAVVDGKKLCGIHARALIRRKQSVLDAKYTPEETKVKLRTEINDIERQLKENK